MAKESWKNLDSNFNLPRFKYNDMVDELIEHVLIEMVGGDGLVIIGSLKKPKTDVQIHERTKIPLSKIRFVLNTLHQYNIVTYSSTRDDDKGWFKYCWELNDEFVVSSVCTYLGSKLMKLKRTYQDINDVTYYKCEGGCDRMCMTDAYELSFKCNCGTMLKPIDPAAESKKIKSEIEEIKKTLSKLPSAHVLQNVY